MKTHALTILMIAALGLTMPLHAAEDGHKHAKKEAGPNGGKILTSVEPHCEFLVTPERKVRLTFLDEEGKPAKVGEQQATAHCGDRANPTRLAFSAHEGVLISDKPLPAGNTVPMVLQLKMAADGKTVTERFAVNLADCPGCHLKEYACTCEHASGGGDSHEGHNH